MADTHVMAQLRSELLNAMYRQFPQALNSDLLAMECRGPFRQQSEAWLTDNIREQLKVLDYAGLIRRSTKGYTLTERGRQDRQQAARFMGNQPPQPPEAA